MWLEPMGLPCFGGTAHSSASCCSGCQRMKPFSILLQNQSISRAVTPSCFQSMWVPIESCEILCSIDALVETISLSERRPGCVESAVALRIDQRLKSARRQYGRPRGLPAGCGVVEHHAFGRHHRERALAREFAIAFHDTIPCRVAAQLLEILEAVEPEFLDPGVLTDTAGFEQGTFENARIEPEPRVLHILAQDSQRLQGLPHLRCVFVLPAALEFLIRQIRPLPQEVD